MGALNILLPIFATLLLLGNYDFDFKFGTTPDMAQFFAFLLIKSFH